MSAESSVCENELTTGRRVCGFDLGRRDPQRRLYDNISKSVPISFIPRLFAFQQWRLLRFGKRTIEEKERERERERERGDNLMK